MSTIANLSTSAFATLAANAVKSAEAAGLKAILSGAIFLKVRGSDVHARLTEALLSQ